MPPTAKLRLRELRPEDGPARLRYLNMREIERMMLTLPQPYTQAHHETFLIKLQTVTDLYFRVIEVDGKMAGAISLGGIEPGHKATLGYWLAPELWGRGLMARAILPFTQEGFERYDLRRIQAYVFAHNPASARVLEKCGYLCEGVLRQDVMKDGHIIDRTVYSKLR